ncbi:MAG: hypothetical protein BGO49_08035 [Planctomycetales bacterium 71-10]|nr:MAG: hypothetical protein BGO49_08035 [Planctomycetales bacterium 71-10]
MTPAPPCPAPEALRRLGADSLDAPAFRELEAHVAACAPCRALLERLARADATETAAGPVDAPATVPPIPGCILGAELGRGGWGVVYEAEQPRLGRRVAVKVLAAAPDLDARARGRWLREARAAAKVRHPNVVRLHDAGEHAGRLYLVFDLVPGGSLRDRAGGPIPPADAARLVEAIARAVEAIHRAGLLHLDVKPANILMDGPPGAGWGALTPMLSDFGIAREATEAVGEPGASGTLAGRGTPAYMAPEQVAGRPGTIGPAADVFALGATLYALLAGRPPFQGATAIETLDLLRTTEPPPPRALAPKVPRDLETICLKALQKAPSRRYASAAALADDLSRWREGRPIRARPVSAAGRAARWCRRHPAPAALAVALAATALLALAGLASLWRRSERQRDRAEAALARALQGEEAADRVAVDLVAMLRDSVEAPERFVSQRSDDASRAILALTADLRRTPELAARHAAALSALELELALLRTTRTDEEGARRLLDDAVGLLAVRPAGGRDADADVRLAEALLRRAELDGRTGRVAGAAADGRLAARALAPHAGDPRAWDGLVDLHLVHLYIADRMTQHGDHEAAARLARDRAAEAGASARRHPDDPMLGLLARLARAEAAAGPPRSATSWSREAFASFPGGVGVPRRLASLLADAHAQELCDAARASVAERADATATAARLLAEIDSRALVLDAGPRFRADVMECLSQAGCVAALEARRGGRLDDARRHAGWMVALGGMLTGRGDDASAAHVMISRAREQEAKVAWAVDDRAAVDRALRAALAEATLAFDAAPDDLTPRVLIAGIREKYARFAAAEPERPRPAEAPR